MHIAVLGIVKNDLPYNQLSAFIPTFIFQFILLLILPGRGVTLFMWCVCYIYVIVTEQLTFTQSLYNIHTVGQGVNLDCLSVDY